jgi:mutator protein MutT
LPELPPLEVPIAVILHEGRLLISQRMPGDSFGGFWEFPGGRMAAGETMELCLAREIREELGVVVEVGSKRMEISHRYPGRTIRLHCFDCRLLEGEPRALECASWQWVLPAELDRFSFPPASKALIRALQGTVSPIPHDS